MQKRGAGVADFREEERQILGSVLPNVAAALRTPLNNLHMAAERIARQLPDGRQGISLLDHRSCDPENDLIPQLHIQRFFALKINFYNHKATLFCCLTKGISFDIQ